MISLRNSIAFVWVILLTVSFSFAQEATESPQENEENAEATAQDASASEDDGIPTDPEIISAGESIFTANCKQCHAIHERVIGPALANVHNRLETPYLYSWIRNSQKVIASGDEYAVNLYNEYGKVAMPSYSFSDEELLSILAYIKDETIKGPPQEEVVAAEGDGQVAQAANPMESTYLVAVLVILVVVLVLILVVLALIVSILTKYLKEQKELDPVDAEVVNQRIDVLAFFKSNAFLGTVVFIFTALVLKTLIDGAFSIGIQQGYQPTQPIAFSHQLHAGQYEIGCEYCHTGVRKAKSANIPSANICMNCHSEIKTDSEEIQKIYAAIDYDPETREYGNNTKPIEWVRVHNLPDLAYFNHAQHVAVGGLECETCHGPIEEMEVVYQYANLTMGWCINCHRETEVNTEGNAYYDKLVKLHESRSKEPMKVEDIGGLECSKCHY
jgi:mono/diheme cytochrome c family protein